MPILSQDERAIADDFLKIYNLSDDTAKQLMREYITLNLESEDPDNDPMVRRNSRKMAVFFHTDKRKDLEGPTKDLEEAKLNAKVQATKLKFAPEDPVLKAQLEAALKEVELKEAHLNKILVPAKSTLRFILPSTGDDVSITRRDVFLAIKDSFKERVSEPLSLFVKFIKEKIPDINVQVEETETGGTLTFQDKEYEEVMKHFATQLGFKFEATHEGFKISNTEEIEQTFKKSKSPMTATEFNRVLQYLNDRKIIRSEPSKTTLPSIKPLPRSDVSYSPATSTSASPTPVTSSTSRSFADRFSNATADSQKVSSTYSSSGPSRASTPGYQVKESHLPKIQGASSTKTEDAFKKLAAQLKTFGDDGFRAELKVIFQNFKKPEEIREILKNIEKNDKNIFGLMKRKENKYSIALWLTIDKMKDPDLKAHLEKGTIPEPDKKVLDEVYAKQPKKRPHLPKLG